MAWQGRWFGKGKGDLSTDVSRYLGVQVFIINMGSSHEHPNGSRQIINGTLRLIVLKYPCDSVYPCDGYTESHVMDMPSHMGIFSYTESHGYFCCCKVGQMKLLVSNDSAMHEIEILWTACIVHGTFTDYQKGTMRRNVPLIDWGCNTALVDDGMLTENLSACQHVTIH